MRSNLLRACSQVPHTGFFPSTSAPSVCAVRASEIKERQAGIQLLFAHARFPSTQDFLRLVQLSQCVQSGLL